MAEQGVSPGTTLRKKDDAQFVSFLQRNAPPPSALYVNQNDNLIWRIAGGFLAVEYTLRARLLRFDGEIIQVEFTQTSVGTPSSSVTRTIPLTEGFILGLSVSTADATANAVPNYHIVSIARGSGTFANTHNVITKGFATSNVPLTWPGERFLLPLEHHGQLAIITGTNPALGVEIAETVPSSTIWEILAIAATLVTSAVGAARTARLAFDDGTTAFKILPPETTQGVSTTFTYYLAELGFAPATDSLRVAWNGAPPLELAPGHRFRTNTGNLDVNDNWSAPTYYVRRRSIV